MARRAAPLLRAALLCAALLCARAQAAAPASSPASDDAAPVSMPLLALGTVLHAPWAPAGAPVLEKHALLYLRCYATNSSAADEHPDDLPLGAAPGSPGGITAHMVAAAAAASRGAGLHATLPVEAVASARAPAAGTADVAGNAYVVGDWAALGSGELWCELYDIDRAHAGLTDALGGALLRAADFAAAGTDQLRCVRRRHPHASRARN